MIASRQLKVIWFSGNLSFPPPSPTMSLCVESVHCFFPDGPAVGMFSVKFSMFHNGFGLIYA